MLLTVDIGNTNIVFGVHDGASWRHTWRIQTVRERMPDEYAVMFRSFFATAGLAFADVDQLVLSSVVPQLTPGFTAMLARETGRAPLIVTGHVDAGIIIDPRVADQIGPDLVANAAAAYHHFRAACVVVDFGTATTITLIGGDGALGGVVIAAGLRTTHDALVSSAALLPAIPLEFPPLPIGYDTVTALQAGLVLGHLAMVEGLIARIRAEVGPLRVAATGGLSGLFSEHSDVFDFVDTLLTLNGLRLIAGRAR